MRSQAMQKRHDEARAAADIADLERVHGRTALAVAGKAGALAAGRGAGDVAGCGCSFEGTIGTVARTSRNPMVES